MKIKKLNLFLSILLLLLILINIFLFFENYETFKLKLNEDSIYYFTNNNLFVKVNVKDNKNIKLYVGDLLGIEKNLQNKILNLSKNKNINNYILITKIYDNNSKNFYDAISDNGIILPDNFCTKNWSSLKSKKIYKTTYLSSGNFCFSDENAILINNIFLSYNISKIIIFYNDKTYLKSINNFLTYLNETNKTYQLIKI